eukprot:6176043-Pleurochrysis_carterae.AAC.7
MTHPSNVSASLSFQSRLVDCSSFQVRPISRARCELASSRTHVFRVCLLRYTRAAAWPICCVRLQLVTGFRSVLTCDWSRGICGTDALTKVRGDRRGRGQGQKPKKKRESERERERERASETETETETETERARQRQRQRQRRGERILVRGHRERVTAGERDGCRGK